MRSERYYDQALDYIKRLETGAPDNLSAELSRLRQMCVRPRFRGKPGREDLRLDRRSERRIGDRAGFSSELEHRVVREGQLARDLAGVGGRVEGNGEQKNEHGSFSCDVRGWVYRNRHGEQTRIDRVGIVGRPRAGARHGRGARRGRRALVRGRGAFHTFVPPGPIRATASVWPSGEKAAFHAMSDPNVRSLWSRVCRQR